MEKTVFKNVDEFVAWLLEAEPLIDQLELMLRVKPNPQLADIVRKARAFFANDAALAREVAARNAKPDGRIELGMMQEALLLLREMERR